MSFASVLREIAGGCGGGIAAALMGNDGIPVAQVTLPGAGDEELPAGIETAGTEFGRILDEIRKASDALAAGAMLESVVCLSRVTLLFRAVDEDSFLVLALAPDGNLGKARYLMRRHLPAIRSLL